MSELEDSAAGAQGTAGRASGGPHVTASVGSGSGQTRTPRLLSRRGWHFPVSSPRATPQTRSHREQGGLSLSACF